MSTIRTEIELTEEQLDILKPLLEQANTDWFEDGIAGSIIIKMNGLIQCPSATAYYFPYKDAKYLQATMFVARKKEAISEFMELKEGEEHDG